MGLICSLGFPLQWQLHQSGPQKPAVRHERMITYDGVCSPLNAILLCYNNCCTRCTLSKLFLPNEGWWMCDKSPESVFVYFVFISNHVFSMVLKNCVKLLAERRVLVSCPLSPFLFDLLSKPSTAKTLALMSFSVHYFN